MGLSTSIHIVSPSATLIAFISMVAPAMDIFMLKSMRRCFSSPYVTLPSMVRSAACPIWEVCVVTL
jgi:hypothetical protein